MEIKLKLLLLAVVDAFLISICTLLFKDNINAIFFLALMVSVVSLKALQHMLRVEVKRAREEMERALLENKEMEKIRSEFVTNVTHELKTPLTSISGFVETLQNGAVENRETRERFIGIIAEETARLKRLIDDILTLSDIENKGHYPSADIDINIHAAVEDIVKILENLSEKRKIKLHNDTDEKCNLKGNSDRFKQLMLNLIENAIKYGKENGNVWISTYEKEEKHIISVKDDGIGIGKEDLNRITERFYRADKSRSSLVGGTGLGLSIVKHAVASFGGQLIINSKINEGSEFRVEIPLTYCKED